MKKRSSHCFNKFKRRNFYSKKKFSKDQLIKKLSLLKKNNQNLKIYIKGDKKLDYGKVMDLMNLINQSGFKKVALVTRLK